MEKSKSQMTNNDKQFQGATDHNSGPIRGTCLTMCPNDELRLRQRENLIHPLESKVNEKGQRLGFGDPKRMVKEFARSAAGHQIKAADVRSIPILQRTVSYLLSVVCAYEDLSWREIYDFVNDRLRAVRQDITVQHLRGKEVIKVLASAARFYVYGHYRLCEYELSEFDPHLNLQQLNEIILTLLSILKDHSYVVEAGTIDYSHKLRKNSLSTENRCNSPTEDCDSSHTFRDSSDIGALVERCHITNGDEREQNQSAVANPGGAEEGTVERETPYSNINYIPTSSTDDDDEEEDYSNSDSNDLATWQVEGGDLSFSKYSVIEEVVSLYVLINIGRLEVLSEVLEMPKSVRASPLVSRVTEASMSWMKGNHLPLVRLSSALTPVLASALHLHLNKVQRQALGVLSVAHSSKILSYSSEDLKSHLLFSSAESLRKACQHYGLSTSSQGIQFIKANFKWDAPLLKSEKAEWLESKLKSFTISELLLGY